MWSGPRNISTAMMRSWGNRADTVVVDEPFYAYYLDKTGANHPGAAEVIADGETDWRKVVEQLTDHTPGKAIFYQKQMTHHLLPEISRDWLHEVTNCFLIRHPAEVICSYIKKNHDPSVEDVGFLHQTEIFELVRASDGSVPPVLDARDVLENPRRILGLLCDAVGVSFTDRMLSWPTGLRETDGIWAKHWYSEVANSTGFQPYTAKLPKVPERLHSIYERSLEIYRRLREYRLR
jgi:hypothetical protein